MMLELDPDTRERSVDDMHKGAAGTVRSRRLAVRQSELQEEGRTTTAITQNPSTISPDHARCLRRCRYDAVSFG